MSFSHERQAAPPDRVYPHLYDPASSPDGGAMRLIADALGDAQAAVDCFTEADLHGVSTSLGLVAASLARAHQHTTFNESLGSVVSYIRRATLRADAATLDLAQLMQLAQVLRTIQGQPMLDLETAAGLADDLSAAGWDGELYEVNALLRALWDTDEGRAELPLGDEVSNSRAS
jgi:hypothetical protein